MKTIDTLLLLANTYCAAMALSESRVSTIIFNDGKILGRLRAGAEITVGRAEKATQWFSDNWPDGLAWPEDAARPSAAARIEAAE